MKIVLVLLLVMLVRSEVVLLEESTIEAFIAENPRVLVFFTAEWSKDCKKFLPSFQKLEKKVLKEKRDVKLAMIDSGNNTALEQKYKIVGYPTLKHFNEGVVSNFKPRKYIDLMLSELELFELPSHFVVDNKEKFAEIQKSEEHPVAVLYQGPKDHLLGETFIGLCNDHRTQPRSNYVVYQEGEPTLTLFHKKDGIEKVYQGSVDAKAISAFIKENSFKFIQELNEYTFNLALTQQAPLFVIKYNTKESKNETVQILNNLKQSLSQQIRFGLTNNKKVIKFLEGDLGSQFTMLIRLFDKSGDLYYKVDGEITEENIKNYISQYQQGLLKKVEKSEAELQDSDQAVQKAVKTNFQSLVVDGSNTRDILVMFHAPWCAACKYLKPIFRALAKEISKDQLLFVTYNADANSLVYPLKFYPTLVLYKSGGQFVEKKSHHNSKKNLLKFLRDNMSSTLNVLDSEVKEKELLEKKKQEKAEKKAKKELEKKQQEQEKAEL